MMKIAIPVNNQKMPGCLLELGVMIDRISFGVHEVEDIVAEAQQNPQLLTSTEQGLPSKNHQHKQEQGGCGKFDQLRYAINKNYWSKKSCCHGRHDV